MLMLMLKRRVFVGRQGLPYCTEGEIMVFGRLKGISLAAAICLSGFATGLANAANAADDAASADAFLRSYYAAMQSVKGPEDIEKYLSIEVKKKKKIEPVDKEMLPFFIDMIKSSHPVDVNIVSKKEEGDRIVYELTPKPVPKAVEEMAKAPTFSMKGSAILVKEDGQWKVYKDYWVAESKSKDGNMRMSFGTDPDKKDRDMANEPSGEPRDYSSQLRDYLMEKWKQDGTGKEIYVVMKIAQDGSLSDLQIGGEKPQSDAVEKLKSFFASVQPLPALPKDYAEKPYAWMMLDWEKEKGRAISGPYFSEKAPDWVLEKISNKPAASSTR